MPVPQLVYVFDPLCGWCYASAPALAALAHNWPGQIEMLPSGLFSESGARTLTLDWAQYAWTNDQRIARVTGQIFSDAYHSNVLLGEGVQFDSGAMNRALTAIRTLDLLLEPKLLHELQIARYVDGRDTSLASVVADVSAAVASQSGNALHVTEFENRLLADELLAEETLARLRSTQKFMAQLNIRGVPQLLVHADGKLVTVESSALYQDPTTLVERLRKQFT